MEIAFFFFPTGDAAQSLCSFPQSFIPQFVLASSRLVFDNEQC